MNRVLKARIVENFGSQFEFAHAARSVKPISLHKSGNNPYLVKKKILANGARQARDGRLMLALRNIDGRITTVQYIDDQGGKLYLKGGQKQGSFYTLEGDRQTIYFAEGLGFTGGAASHSWRARSAAWSRVRFSSASRIRFCCSIRCR